MAAGLAVLVIGGREEATDALARAVDQLPFVTRALRARPGMPVDDPATLDVAVWAADAGLDALVAGLEAAQVAIAPPPIAPMSADATAHDIARALEPFALGRELAARDANRQLVLRDMSKALAHELKAPLGSVRRLLSFADRRLGEGAREEARDAARRASAAAERAETLIASLFELATLERGPAGEMVSLDIVARAAAADVITARPSPAPAIDIAPLPEVEGDAALLTDVFRKLFDNAIRYASDPAPWIGVSAEETARAHVVSVDDAGPGVEPDERLRIFEPLVRLHGPQTHRGAGVGLAACAKALALHGGAIRCEARPDGSPGARFVLEFPKAAAR